jgi:ATP synthase protein I
LPAYFSDRVRSQELVGICLLAERGNLAQLILAECKEIALELRLKQWVPLPRIITAVGTSDQPDPKSKDGALQSLVRVESLIQLGLVLPAAVVIGWALGLVLDHWLKQHWINIVGVILGAVSGFVYIFRVVLSHSKE